MYSGGDDAIEAAKKIASIAGMINKTHNAGDFSSYRYPLMLRSDEIYNSSNKIITTSLKNPIAKTYTLSSVNIVLGLAADKLTYVERPATGGEGADVTAFIDLGGLSGKPAGPSERLETTDDTGRQADIQIQNGKILTHKMKFTEHNNTPSRDSYLQTPHDDWYKFMLIKFDDAKGDIAYIKVHGESYLKFEFVFTYEGPSANQITDFKIEPVKDSSGKDDVSSRKLSFSWTEQGYEEGQAPFKEMKTVGKASFEIYDVGDSTSVDDSNQILIYKTDSVSKTKKTSPTTVRKYAAIYGVNRPYRIYERLFDSSGTLIAGASTKYAGIIAPTPAVISSPATKLVGNTSSEEDLYDQISTGSVLTDQSVTLKWTNPTISHAESFRVNYEIMFSTDGKTFKHLDYVYSDKNKCPTVQKGKTILSNQPESGADQYVNKYVIDKTVLNANNIKNYDRVYVGVKIVISKNYNDPITYYDKTRTLSQTRQEMTSMNQDMIENFICVYECNVHYCPDGFTWRKCLVYYCPEGEKWVPVVLRWSPTGDHWVYC